MEPSSPDAIIVTGVDGEIIYTNSTAILWLGDLPESFTADGVLARIHPEDREMASRRLAHRRTQPGSGSGISFRMLHPDGSYHWVESFGTNLLKHPKAQVFLVSWRDVSEQKRLESELRRERQFGETVVDTLPALFYLLDPNGNILRWNAGKVTGYSDDEVADMNALDFVAEEDRWLVAQKFQEAYTTGSARLEVTFVTRDGRRLSYLTTGQRVELDGQPHLIGMGIDISERKRADEEVRRLNAELEQRVSERTAELEAFSYSVSHDLRAPLRHMDGFAKLLVRRAGPQLDAAALRYARLICDSAERMGRLIDDLLSFSRTARVEMRMQRVDLDDLVADVRAQLEPATTTVTWQIEPLPAVRGDPSLLRVAWTNLLSNSLKFTRPRSAPRIEVGARKDDQGMVTLHVGDNGVGFDPQYTHKLFEVFQRLHHEDEFEGTGVGLATVRRIIQRHGGAIWAEGRLDLGATFYFSLRCEPEGG